MTFALVEAVAVFAAIAGTIVAWGRGPVTDWLDTAVVLVQAAAVSIACIVAFYYNDLYDFRIVRSVGGFGARLTQALGVALILLAGFYTLLPDARVADGAFFSSLVVMVGLLLPLRAIGYAIMRARAFADRVLIIGSGPLARTLIEEIEARPHLGYNIVGVVDDVSDAEAPPLGHLILGPLEHVGKIAEELRLHRIVVALNERRGRMPMEQLLKAEAHGIVVEDGLETYERFTKKLAIETLRPSLLVFSKGFRKTRVQLALRRLVSLAIGFAALVVTAPVMAVIALAIALDSGRPILFAQNRVGPRGRHFRLLKFRTMVPATSVTSEWARDNTDRITSVGRWLRKYRLDELPQFFNVLRGDMNLVGPRPHPVSNYELFSAQIPYYVLRTSVRPGVTGWAQIRYGYANDLDEEIEKMRYDLYYIKHLSFWFDLRIIFDTVKTILFGQETVAAAGASSIRPRERSQSTAHRPNPQVGAVDGPGAASRDLPGRWKAFLPRAAAK